MIAIRLAVFGALALALWGQPKPEDSKPRDVSGWDKITWGMTIAEARSAYGLETQPEAQDDWTLLQLKPVKMGGVEMGVQVGARRVTGKISSVRLWSYFGLSTSAPEASAHDFDTLRTLLVQKYGTPAKEETQHGENFRLIETVVWTFPSTAILMTLEQSSSIPNIGRIFLEYTAADN